MKALSTAEIERWEPPPPDVDKICKLVDLTDRIVTRRKAGPIGERLPWETAHSYLRFAPGWLTLWAGGPASFKSTVLSQIVLGFAEQGARTCVTSLEEPIEEYGDRLSKQGLAEENSSAQALARFHAATNDLILMWDLEGHLDVKRVLKMMRYAAYELNAQHFVFDNVTKVLDPSNDGATVQWRFINEAHSIARQTKMHVHLVMHSRKEGRDGGVPSMNDIRGSSTASDLADQIVMTWRNRQKEDLQDGTIDLDDNDRNKVLKQPDVVLAVEKAKFGGREGKIGLWRDIPSRLFFHGSMVEPRPCSLMLREAA